MKEAIFQIQVMMSDDNEKAQVSIGCTIVPPPLEMAIVACEHLMTACALRSGAGFEHGLELLAEGARKNKVLSSDGKAAGNA